MADWYAYQCRSGEILFYYNKTSGEHRWAIHFCSCLKSKMSNSGSEPCCVWEPTKSHPTPESGKFVRSMGTQTEEYHQNSQSFVLNASEKKNKQNQLLLPQKPGNIGRTDIIIGRKFADSKASSTSVPHLTVNVNDALNNRSQNDTISSKGPESNGTESMDFMIEQNAVLHKDVGDQVAIPLMSNDPTSTITSENSFPGTNTWESNEANTFSRSHKSRKTNEGSSSRKKREPRKLLRKVATAFECEGEPREGMGMEWENDLKKEKLFESHLEIEAEPMYMTATSSTSDASSQLMPSCEGSPEDDDKNAIVGSQVLSICELCGHDCGNPTRLTEHIMSHQPSGAKCPICDRQFSRRVGLRFHVRIHSGDKPHECHLCEKAFTKPASLVAHIRTHSSERPYVCHLCDKGFTHPSNLTSHIKTHSDNRPFQCAHCSKGFKTSSHLVLHMRTHSNERPYACKQCQKTFKSSSHLRTHEKLHESGGSYVCSKCDQGFKSFSLFSYHLQSNPLCSLEGTSSEETFVLEGESATE